MSVDGDLVGMLTILGPHSGHIEVDDGHVSQEHLLWDEECSYERLGSVIFEPFPAARSDVRIRIVDRPVDYANARRSIDPVATARSS
ncbi:MAG TPA: hypothetical protein VGM80_01095 [Gaiellaceae bacterium]